MLNEAIKKIEAQQAKLGKSPAYWVGEQLKDMLRAEPWNADLVARDLDVPEMAITAVEKKIKAAADKNKKGNVGFVSPMEWKRIKSSGSSTDSARRKRATPLPRRMNRRRKSVKPSGWKISCNGGGPDDLEKG